MKKAFIFIPISIAILLSGCTAEKKADPAVVTPETNKASVIVTPKLTELTKLDQLKEYIGFQVIVVAVQSSPDEIMQHMVEPWPDKSVISYWDFDGSQIVVYSAEPIKADASAKVRITGSLKLISAGGEPGTMGSYEGYHIYCDKWEVVK